jgi:pimeloyl-ACP methyl ester carboxylesterase
MAAGCAETRDQRLANAERIAEEGGLRLSWIDADGFRLAAFSRRTTPEAPLSVYIEGDGHGWITKTRLSSDPTPRHPVALILAARDPAPNVLYLGRPCQYDGAGDNPRCDAGLWSDARYSERVVAALSQAIDLFQGQEQGQARRPGIHLVGYSGGGAVAILIAARRDDVRTVRTVAGDLDSDATTNFHSVSPLTRSLNPADAARQIAGIPQLHYVGTEDDVIPPIVAESYIRRVQESHCVTIRPVAGATHGDGWDSLWRQAATEYPRCSR